MVSLKTVKPEDSKEVYQRNGWKWIVLKHYQQPENEAKNPYARVFCQVSSPLCPEGELGDVYISEIKQAMGEAEAVF